MKRPLRSRILALGLLSIAVTVNAANVDKPEVTKVQKVEFKNRNEKKAPLSMIVQQIQFGRGAAKAVTSGAGTFDGKGYSVKRIYDEKEPKFGADVVTIKKDFKGGHVDVIKRFLIGYLEVVFDYNRQDARILAQFILYYNGVFRGNIGKFQADYAPQVAPALVPAKVGLSRKWQEWPDKAQIVIPLQKSIVKEAENVGKPADEVKPPIDVPVKELVKETEPVIVEQAPTPAEKEQAIEDLKIIKDFEEKKKQEEAVQVEVIKEKKKKKLNELTDYIVSEDLGEEDKAKALDDKKKLEDDLSKMPKDETPDTSEDDSKNIIAGKIYVLKTVDYVKDGHYDNSMFIIDPVSDNAVVKSPYKKVCGNDFVEFADGIIVIGKKDDGDKHYLVKLDKDQLAVQQYGASTVYWRSPLIVKGKAKGQLWVIEDIGGKYYLARYNKALKREAISSVQIQGDAIMTFFKKKVYITGSKQADKNILVFNRSDLKLLKTIETK